MSAENDIIVQPDAGETAIEYAKAVLNGTIIAGTLVKLACKRFLTDLETGESRGFYFDAEAAQHAVDFFGFLRHTKGVWAKKAETAGFLLSPWQVFILANLFGWKRIADGSRRFREAHIELARKNGKSTFIAGIGLYMLYADGEPGAEVYSAATTKEQARIVFHAAKDMVKVSEYLRGRIGIWRNNLHVDISSSKFEPLASDSGTLDGLNIHCGLVDELHEHPTRGLYDVLQTAIGSRQQPLMLAITTAGVDREGICWAQRSIVVKLLQGVLPDDDFINRTDNACFFGFVATLDDKDDPWDERNWPKANPNLGVSVSVDALRPGATKAKEDPTATNEFLRKHLNLWTTTESAWLAPDVWEKNNGTPLVNPKAQREAAMEMLKGRRCFAGLDLAEVNDNNSLVLVFPPQQETVGFEALGGQRCLNFKSTKEVKLVGGEEADREIKFGHAVEIFGSEIPEKLRQPVVRFAALEKWYILAWFWIPKAHVEMRAKAHRAPYEAWIREGFIEATEGDTVNQEAIRNSIRKITEQFRCQQLGFDKWGMEWLGPKLVEDGLDAIAIPQRFEFLSKPFKNFTAFLGTGNCEHFGNPVLRWHASNVQVLEDTNGNQRPDKGKSRGKIDGIVAADMAFGRALDNPIPAGADADERFKVRYI